MARGEGGKSSYMGKIGGYFVFVALAGVVIISWVINWIFWIKKICCCKVYHNPTITRIYWWSAFIFLCGIIACCISGFITTHRFGKIIPAVQCTYERIYYDSEFGQMKDSSPKWEGLEVNSKKLGNISNLLNNLQEKNDEEFYSYFLPNDNNDQWKIDETFFDDDSNYKFKGKYYNDYLNDIKDLLKQLKGIGGILNTDNSKIFFNPDKPGDTSTIVGEFIYQTNQIVNLYEDFEDSFLNLKLFGNPDNLNDTINNFLNISEDLKSYKNGYLDDVEYYVKVAKGCGYILVIIYLSILGLISLLGCAVLMAYAYMQKQVNFDKIMHIIWNSIKFFSFSFFMYGAAFGMLFLGLRDIITYNRYLFGEENLDSNSATYVLPKKEAKDFLRYCLFEEKTDYSIQLGSFPYDDINTFFNNFYELNTLFQNYNNTLNSKFKDIYFVNKNIRNLEIYPTTPESNLPTEEGIPFSLPKAKQLEMINQLNAKLKTIEDDFNLSNFFYYDKGNFMDSFDCGFLKSDINMVYYSLYDLSIESRILCALSCCIAFFGEISVYFYLLSMYHYDKSIFKEGNLDTNINIVSQKKDLDDESSKNSFMDKYNSAHWKKNNMKLDRKMENKN